MAGAGGGAPTAQVSKAMWTGNSIVVTTTTSAGDVTRTYSIDGDELIVETATPGRLWGANVVKETYRRYVRGSGG